jgi:hypothetical protein
MSLQIYLFCPRLNDLDRPNRRTPTPTVNDCWQRNILGSIASRWLESQSSAIQVLFPQTKPATRLAALMPLGQKVHVLSWTPNQRSAFLGPVASPRPGGAGRHRTSHRPRAHRRRDDPPGWPAAPSLGTRLFAFANSEAMFSPREGGALMGHTDHEAKAQGTKSTSQSRLSRVSR